MSTEVRRRRPRADDGLFLLGIVGRSGSGKSTAARALEAAGAVRIDADQIGHEVTDADPEVRAALISEYGPGVYRADGRLDRAQVAERVFRDADARRRLDQLVHPRILERIERRLDDLRRRGHRGAVVLDAALLLEWGLERGLDAVVAVVAPERERLERLARSRNWSADEVRARHAVQREDAAFAAAADVELENAGTIEELENAARSALARLMEAGRPGSAGSRERPRC